MMEELRPEVPGSVRADPPQVILHFVCNSYLTLIDTFRTTTTTPTTPTTTTTTP